MEKTQKQKIREILEQVEIKGNILDIGSGPGFLEEMIDNISEARNNDICAEHICKANREIQIIALDTDLENLKKVKGLKVLADGNHLPFKKNSFDTIFCIDIIHLIDNISDLMNFKGSHILKENGKIIISIFCNEYNFEEKKTQLKNNISAACNISELTKDKLQKEPSEHINFRIEKEFLIKTKTEWDFVLVLKT